MPKWLALALCLTVSLAADVPPQLPRRSLGEMPLKIRQEILLERAPAAKVIGVLQEQYPNVEFNPHPTMNGFYDRADPSGDEIAA